MRDEALFGVCPDGEFFGRDEEIGDICRRAVQPGRMTPGTFLAGRRWTGKTEVLRRAFRRLFLEEAGVVPIYYRFRECGSAADFAEDFLKEAVKQRLAFVKRDPAILRAEISLDGLERLLAADDAYDMVGLIQSHREARRSGDNTAALRGALKAPHVMTIHSVIPVYLMLDDFHPIPAMTGAGAVIMNEAAESLISGVCPFIVSGVNGNAPGDLNCSVEAMEIGGLGEEEAISMASELCARHNVAFDPEVLSFAVKRLEGTPFYIKNIIALAARSGADLTETRGFAGLYAREISEGNTAFAFRSSLRLYSARDLLLLNECTRKSPSPVAAEELSQALGRGFDEIEASVSRLSASGLVDPSLGSVRWAGDAALRDFVEFACETGVKGRSAEEARTSLVRGLLKEGYRLRSARVRPRILEEASEALKSFDGRLVSRAFFRKEAASADKSGGAGKDEVALPQMAGCFDASRWEKGEKGAVMLAARGFRNGRYGDGDEAVWIAGVKEARTPVNLGDVENFIRRSLILREKFRTPRLVRWLIAEEGFTDEARTRAEGDGIFTSDASQLRALRSALAQKAGQKAEGMSRAREFEMTLPPSARAELVAAAAAGEIGAEMGFDRDAVAGIKTAVIEACINAFEHGRARNGRVFLRFVAGADRLAIYVENPGADFDAPAAREVSMAGEGPGLPRRRGWGMELMKGLMDEVRIEKVMGGARIALVKRLTEGGGRG